MLLDCPVTYLHRHVGESTCPVAEWTRVLDPGGIKPERVLVDLITRRAPPVDGPCEAFGMAGFDFDFSYRPAQQPFLDACLPAAMSRARKLHLRWRNERRGEFVMRCIVDGNGRRMDLLARVLETDLPLVAEGVLGSGMATGRRRRLGLGFADLYIRGMDTRSDATMAWRGVHETRYYFTPYDLSRTEHPMLAARLRITEDVIVHYYFGRVGGPVLLEELHTAAELLLEELVNRRSRRMSFAQRVESARSEGLLDQPEAQADLSAEGDDATLLLRLKDLRKNARHRGDPSFEPWLAENWESVTLVLERLVRRVAR